MLHIATADMNKLIIYLTYNEANVIAGKTAFHLYYLSKIAFHCYKSDESTDELAYIFHFKQISCGPCVFSKTNRFYSVPICYSKTVKSAISAELAPLQSL